MDTLLYVAAFGMGVGVIAGMARRSWRQRDAERRRADRESYRRERQEQRAERARVALTELIVRFFPFAMNEWKARSTPNDGHQRLRLVLADTDGVRLGSADVGFEAVLPDSARRQHFLCLGKSGYGKTTLALHMIRDDLYRGRGLCVLGCEAELFRDWLLPLVPDERSNDVIHFKPVDPACPLTWNPLSLEDGEDQSLAAGELFATFKRAVGETTIGARADAILSSAFGILVGRRGATLWSVIRLLEDESYRAGIVSNVDDPYLREYWTKTFPEYPSGAALPLANRLNRFLRMPQLRAALCHPISSFSIRRALAESQILFFDLSGLDPDSTRLLGQAALSKFQIELFRRERIPERERTSVHVYVDEFHAFAGAAEGTWRELLARGRKYGLGLHLFTQHPNQLPRSLQHEIFGNVSSIVALNLSAADAASVRRELLVPAAGGTTKPAPAEEFVSLAVGEGFARLGSGACALRVRFAPPIDRPDPVLGDRVRETSWKTYAAPPILESEEIMPAKVRRPVDEDGGNRGGSIAPGRGGPQHKMLQQLAKQWGEERGFRANLEEDVLGGAGRVDVVLTREDVRIAIEVCITSSAAEVAETVGKCVASGFNHIVVVGTAETELKRAEERTVETIPAKDKARVQYVLPDGLKSFLDGLPPLADSANRTAGYAVRVEVPVGGQIRHRGALARLVGTALLKRRSPS